MAGGIHFGPVWGFTHRTSHSTVLRGVYDCLADCYYPGWLRFMAQKHSERDRAKLLERRDTPLEDRGLRLIDAIGLLVNLWPHADS
jgi:hypothetical protein